MSEPTLILVLDLRLRKMWSSLLTSGQWRRSTFLTLNGLFALRTRQFELISSFGPWYVALLMDNNKIPK
jgi:hypothetical protein